MSRRETNAKCGQGLHRDVASTNAVVVHNVASVPNNTVEPLSHLELVSGRGEPQTADKAGDVTGIARVNRKLANDECFSTEILSSSLEKRGCASVALHIGDESANAAFEPVNVLSCTGTAKAKEEGRPQPTSSSSTGASTRGKVISGTRTSRSTYIPGFMAENAPDRSGLGNLLKRVREVEIAPVQRKRVRPAQWPVMKLREPGLGRSVHFEGRIRDAGLCLGHELRASSSMETTGFLSTQGVELTRVVHEL